MRLCTLTNTSTPGYHPKAAYIPTHRTRVACSTYVRMHNIFIDNECILWAREFIIMHVMRLETNSRTMSTTCIPYALYTRRRFVHAWLRALCAARWELCAPSIHFFYKFYTLLQVCTRLHSTRRNIDTRHFVSIPIHCNGNRRRCVCISSSNVVVTCKWRTR